MAEILAIVREIGCQRIRQVVPEKKDLVRWISSIGIGMVTLTMVGDF